MKITWMGHSCFVLEQDGYKIVLDPYTGVPGYPALSLRADEALCSHGHFDHHYTAAVQLTAGGKSPFTVEEISTFHDTAMGAVRGGNTVRVLCAGGVRVCHMGDIGHRLLHEQCAKIGTCDVLLLPVGGVYTVDAAEAKAIADALAPRCVVPMHYRHAPFGLKDVGGVEAFLRLFPAGDVKRLSGNSFCVEDGLSPVLVPAYPA